MYTIVKKSFKRELLFCFVLVALVPLAISSIFLIKVIETRITSEYEKETMQQMSAVEETLVHFFEEADRTLEAILQNESIISAIDETDSWIKNKAYTQLYKETQDIREYAQFNIYNEEGDCVFSTSQTGVAGALPAYWGILKVARTHPEKMIIKNAFQADTQEESQLQMARAIFEDEECIGFIVVGVSGSHFEKILDNSYDEKNGIAVLDSFWEEIYSTKTAKEEVLAQTLRERRMSGEGLKQAADGINFYISPVGESGLYLVFGREDVFTEDITRTMFGVILIMAGLSLLLCLVVAQFMSGYLTYPINRLTKAMHRVESGDLDVQIESRRKDELGQLSGNFNTMTRELKRYMELQVKQQQELNESNIAMMQAQLNPHFLYNTLDTIKWVGKANGVPELATLAAGLAKILRTSISPEKFIKLSDEIKLVKSYTNIQKIRFNGSFTFDAEIPLELGDCIVPKLIIQPIVENAIIHGLKEQENGHIFLNAYKKEHRLFIEVDDDGGGIKEEIVRQLHERDREKLKGHIGFYNADTIIRLYYGDAYGVYAEALPERGTRVTMILPVVKEG